jgi:RNA polymerase sigma-70 factor (ECF subfamily)
MLNFSFEILADLILNRSMQENKNASEDADLIIWRKIRSGDATEFSILFKRYYTPLYQFAGRFVKDGPTAENIVQNVFVNLWIEREKRDIQTSLKAYLYQMVHNQCLNLLKQERKNISFEEKVLAYHKTTPSPEENAAEKELYLAVHKAIEKLPLRCRQIYLMKRYDQMKYTEIARILNISVNTVKTQMKRAFKSLLQELSPFLNC